MTVANFVAYRPANGEVLTQAFPLIRRNVL